MPTFFFNVFDGVTVIDRDGTVLSDMVEVRRKAFRLAGDLLAAEAEKSLPPAKWHMEVKDERGVTVIDLSFGVTEAGQD